MVGLDAGPLGNWRGSARNTPSQVPPLPGPWDHVPWRGHTGRKLGVARRLEEHISCQKILLLSQKRTLDDREYFPVSGHRAHPSCTNYTG